MVRGSECGEEMATESGGEFYDGPCRSTRDRKQECRESKKRERTSKQKTHNIRPSFDSDITVSLPSQSSITDIIQPLAPTLSSMSVSSTQSSNPQHKRTASASTAASSDNSSTESPPQSIDKSEPHVQELQNTFVCIIMKAI